MIDSGMEVRELTSVEHVECTGRHRVVTFELLEVETVELPSVLEVDAMDQADLDKQATPEETR